jgi:hypothetical protein
MMMMMMVFSVLGTSRLTDAYKGKAQATDLTKYQGRG